MVEIGQKALTLQNNPERSYRITNLMRRFLLLFAVAFVLSIGIARAIPAHPRPVVVTQSDGTTLTIQLHGDEFLHYTTTSDGYTVLQDHRGQYVYARQSGDGLEVTPYLAHDASQRTSAETAFLSGITKHLKPVMSASVAENARKLRAHEKEKRDKRRANSYDYSQFHGLVILVEFNDKPFSRDDYAEIMEGMVNEEGYTGYYNANGSKERYQGSVRDYFSDSSNSKFQPHFDIAGPVTVSYSQYDPNGTSNVLEILLEAIDLADPEVDFSQYDGDGDGVVDLIYFIMAGNGANYSGNDQRLFWPHRSVIYNPRNYNFVFKDGVALYDYASSVELQGYTSYPRSVKIDGIGTICHEFSHVLGLPDFYDTDYEKNGQSVDPGEWSLMAGGSYLNEGKNPVSYSLFEKYAVGFIGDDELQVIDTLGSYSLENIATSHSGFRINTPHENEYFLFENRQQSGWDAYLPGHGMLVYRVDENNQEVWDYNQVNAYASHNYYEMVRAGGVENHSSGHDPFPGRSRVTSLDNSTSPANLLTWEGLPCKYGLDNISELLGVISFDVIDVNILTSLTLPDSTSIAAGMRIPMQLDIYPMFAPCNPTWTSSDPSVAIVDEEGYVTGVSAGSAVIKVEDESGLSDSCVVSIFESLVAEDIAQLRTIEPDKEAVLRLQDAQVLYLSHIDKSEDVFVRDATGCIVFRNIGFELKQDQLLSGTLYGKRGADSKIPLFTAVEGLTSVGGLELSEGEAAQPRMVKLSELTDDDIGDLVTLQDVRVSMLTEGKKSYAVAVDGEACVLINNRFKIKDLSMPKDYASKIFNVTGIYGSREFEVSGTPYDDIYPVKNLEIVGDATELGITGVETASSSEGAIYSLDGVRHEKATAPGIYLVRRGNQMIKVVRK